MATVTLHPTTRLVLWLFLLVAVQYLSGATIIIVLPILTLLGTRIVQRGGRLIRRARWLLLSLLVVFFWSVPGDPLWNSAIAPTREGVEEGLLQLGHLLLVFMAIAAFLESMPLGDLLSATHALSKPLRRLGIDTDRGVVRLMLALRYAESLPRPRDWRNLLDIPSITAHEHVELDLHLLRWPDYLVAIGLITLAAFCALH